MKSEWQKFISKVDQSNVDGCWPWTGARGPTTKRGAGGKIRRLEDAYGYLGVRRGGRWKKEGAHRLAYLFEHFDLPAGAHVAHRCDNRICCNPSHLFLTDNDGNIADKMAKGRQVKGRACHQAKLTDAEAWIVRTLKGRMTQRELAEAFGVSQSVISAITNRKTWKHVS